MQIGELANCLGVSTKTLRHYESIGILPPALRGENGYRSYPPQTVNLARQIVALRRLNLSLNVIQELLHGSPPETLRQRLLGELDQQRTEMSIEIVVLQGKLEDLEARFLGLIQTPTSKPGQCICGLLNEVCSCEDTEAEIPA